MKTLILIFAMATCGWCQTQSKEEIAFENAVELFNAEEYEKAAAGFSTFLRDYPRHDLRGRAHFNLGLTYKEIGNLEKAKEIFLSILEKRYNERDKNSLMEPYALYKHHTCRQLASIALEQKNFDEAEKYIQYFDKKYPYQHFCGNEWAAYDIYKATMHAKVHAGRNEPERAVKVLVPFLFETGLASNDYAINELDNILKTNFEGVAVKAMFTDAYNSLRVETKKESQTIVMTFYGVDLMISPYSFSIAQEDEGNLDSYRNAVRAHALFLKYL